MTLHRQWVSRQRKVRRDVGLFMGGMKCHGEKSIDDWLTCGAHLLEGKWRACPCIEGQLCPYSWTSKDGERTIAGAKGLIFPKTMTQGQMVEFHFYKIVDINESLHDHFNDYRWNIGFVFGNNCDLATSTSSGRKESPNFWTVVISPYVIVGSISSVLRNHISSCWP